MPGRARHRRWHHLPGSGLTPTPMCGRHAGFPLSGPATLIGMTEILRQIEASVRSLHDDLIDRRPPKTNG